MGPGEVGESEGALGGSGGTAGSAWSLVWSILQREKAPMELVCTPHPKETCDQINKQPYSSFLYQRPWRRGLEVRRQGDRARRLFEQGPEGPWGGLAEISGTGRGAQQWFGSGSWSLGWVRWLGCFEEKEKHQISLPLRKAPRKPLRNTSPSASESEPRALPLNTLNPQPHCQACDPGPCGRKENTEWLSQEPKPQFSSS